MNLICVASISSNGFPGNRTVGYQISPPWFHEKFLSGSAKIAKVKVTIRYSAVFLVATARFVFEIRGVIAEV